VTSDEVAMQRARTLRAYGLRDLDALHLACAERGGVEVLVTTDTRVMNPVVYALEVLS
jgi:predicted nucleic acid-binding protein